MTRNLIQQMRRASKEDIDDRLICVEAIVAENEDPEHQHRIKVVIPTMDEHQVRDEWVRPMVPYVGGPGFGSFLVPPRGTEVVLFGRLGQKHNLFYLSVYNEDCPVPTDFQQQHPETVAGFRVPGDFKLIVEGDLQIRCNRLHLETDGAINIIAPGGFFVNGRPV
ncbi:MAG TPA: phage baseplate assembly protein V [Pyrinomonadaceae bacterium]|nr:phage baseplate assembly protein V [Pyrinomonadaceae bacterium]